MAGPSEGLMTKALSGTGASGAVATVAGKGGGMASQACAPGSAAAGGLKALTTGSGTIWTGKGLSLGLGLGLGVWGPMLLIGSGVAAYYAYQEYRKRQALTDEEVAEGEPDQGFYPAEG